MRLNDIMEAIAHPPRNFKVYAQGLIKKFTAISAALPEIAKTLKEADDSDSGFAYYVRNDWHRTPGLEDLDVGIPGMLEYVARRFDENLQPLEFARDLQNVLQYGFDFLKYYMGKFQYVDPWIEQNSRPCLLILDHIDAFHDYLEEQGKLEDDEAGDLPERYFAALHKLQWCLSTMLDALTDSKKKLGELHRMKNHFGDPDKYRPEHEQVETLYHASAFASEIVKAGFQAERPDAYRGLGNYGEQKGISFTYDLAIAKEISRGLKELSMIGRGELTARHIIGWAKREGLDVSKADPIKNHYNHPERPWGIKDAAEMYNWYLWMNKIRSNPVFTNMERLAQSMASRNPKDIGVLACQVDLTDYHEFLHAEREFRVPASAVRSIKRLF